MHRATDTPRTFTSYGLYLTPHYKFYIHTYNLHLQPLEATQKFHFHVVLLTGFVSILFWSVRMGPIRGLKRKERGDKDINEEVQDNGGPCLPSQPQSFDWWDHFSKRLTGMFVFVLLNLPTLMFLTIHSLARLNHYNYLVRYLRLDHNISASDDFLGLAVSPSSP